jgi:Holliday junction resolvase RusA-like endonuclease
MLTLGQQWEEIASNQQIQKASLWVYVHPKTLGDADNILGAIMDCLVQSGIIADDYLKNIPRAHVKIKSYLEETNEIFIRVHEWGREIVNLPLATEENYSEEFPDVF